MSVPVRKTPKISINVSMSRYPVVREVASELGYKVSENKDDERGWTLWWMDASVAPERVMRMEGYQYINHFANMNSICRKISLCRNMRKMKRHFPRSFRYSPPTWVLPTDLHLFQTTQTRGKTKKSTLIVKPNTGCQGRGIVLTNDPYEVQKYGDAVVQKYIDRPFLIDGFKFDLRVYILVMSVDPLKVYFYKEGLVRMCTTKYVKPTTRNLKNQYMHLTNYAVNKSNKEFVQPPCCEDGKSGSKRDFQFLSDYVASKGHDPKRMWTRIKSICVKTILSVLPLLQDTYRKCVSGVGGVAGKYKKNQNYACFEILGGDIMLDDKLNPWLLELNHSPSFATDSLLDHRIKKGVIKEALQLVGINPYEKVKIMKQEKADQQARIYPSDHPKPIHPTSSACSSVSRSKQAPKADSTLSKVYWEGRHPEEIEDFHEMLENKYMNMYEKIYPLPPNYKMMRRYQEFIQKAESLFFRTNHAKSRYSEYMFSIKAKHAYHQQKYNSDQSSRASSSRPSKSRSSGRQFRRTKSEKTSMTTQEKKIYDISKSDKSDEESSDKEKEVVVKKKMKRSASGNGKKAGRPMTAGMYGNSTRRRMKFKSKTLDGKSKRLLKRGGVKRRNKSRVMKENRIMKSKRPNKIQRRLLSHIKILERAVEEQKDLKERFIHLEDKNLELSALYESEKKVTAELEKELLEPTQSSSKGGESDKELLLEEIEVKSAIIEEQQQEIDVLTSELEQKEDAIEELKENMKNIQMVIKTMKESHKVEIEKISTSSTTTTTTTTISPQQLNPSIGKIKDDVRKSGKKRRTIQEEQLLDELDLSYESNSVDDPLQRRKLDPNSLSRPSKPTIENEPPSHPTSPLPPKPTSPSLLSTAAIPVLPSISSITQAQDPSQVEQKLHRRISILERELRDIRLLHKDELGTLVKHHQETLLLKEKRHQSETRRKNVEHGAMEKQLSKAREERVTTQLKLEKIKEIQLQQQQIMANIIEKEKNQLARTHKKVFKRGITTLKEIQKQIVDENADLKKSNFVLMKRLNEVKEIEGNIRYMKISISEKDEVIGKLNESLRKKDLLIKHENRGFLRKEGGRIKNLKWRWFVFDNNGFSYFKDNKDKKPLGIVTKKNGGKGFKVMSKVEGGNELSFGILAPDSRVYRVEAASHSEKTRWMIFLDDWEKIMNE